MKIALFRIIEKRNINVMEIAASSILDILSLFKIPTSSIQELWNAHCERKLAESFNKTRYEVRKILERWKMNQNNNVPSGREEN